MMEYPASPKAATMRAARALGSPCAVSLIVLAMIRSTVGTPALDILSLSSLPWCQHQPPLSGCRARGLADAMGDRSRLRDTMTDRDRIGLETYRDARAAMALIREAVEDCAPPGSVTREGYLTPEFTVQAEALVRGIYAIANRRPSKRR